MDRGTATIAPRKGSSTDVAGPPLLILALGFASVVVSLPLISADGIAAHVVGYVTGALVPILVVGLVRRLDLERRRNPAYQAKAFLQPASVALLVAALLAGAVHVWPIATELAS